MNEVAVVSLPPLAPVLVKSTMISAEATEATVNKERRIEAVVSGLNIST